MTQLTIPAWLLLLLTSVTCVRGHMRWTCPEPRSADTGIKVGPCGRDTDVVSQTKAMVIKPGPLTVQWEESITHVGAPFRIVLSPDGRDTDTSTGTKSCVLLDHIPHNDATDPSFLVESTYELYTLTIQIPNVSCARCSLHIINPMTDKIGTDGAPNGVGCTDPNGTCESVYHSCTGPLKITGTTRRADYKCPAQNPVDWPKQWRGDGNQNVTTTRRGVYRRESGTWKNGLLSGVPRRYRTINRNATNVKCLNLQYVDPPRPARSPVPATTGTSETAPALAPTSGSTTFWDRLRAFLRNVVSSLAKRFTL